MLVALVFLNPFYRDTIRYYINNITCNVVFVDGMSLEKCARTHTHARTHTRATFGEIWRKNLDEGATPILIIHLLIHIIC